jgi:hypothetical protein
MGGAMGFKPINFECLSEEDKLELRRILDEQKLALESAILATDFLLGSITQSLLGKKKSRKKSRKKSKKKR